MYLIFRQLKAVADIQHALKEFGAHSEALAHLSKQRDETVREVIAFQAAMLFGANKEIQNTFIEYFDKTKETFFVAIQSRMHISINCTKERRFLQSQIRDQIADRVQLLTQLQKAIKKGELSENVNINIMKIISRSKCIKQCF